MMGMDHWHKVVTVLISLPCSPVEMSECLSPLLFSPSGGLSNVISVNASPPDSWCQAALNHVIGTSATKE
jgi:hypothetical protein